MLASILQDQLIIRLTINMHKYGTELINSNPYSVW